MEKTEDFITDLAIGGFVDPIGKRASYTASRLAILSDGTPKPVLLILAERTFGTWEEDRFPFWIDGNLRNETLGNVGLATRASQKKRRRLRRSPLGVPGGTKEYMRRWQAAHPEAQRASQKRYHERQKAQRAALAALQPQNVPDEPETDDFDSATYVPEVFAKLEAALAPPTSRDFGKQSG